MNRTRQQASASCPAVFTARHTAVPVAPLNAVSLNPSASVGGSVQAVQGTPEYRQAVRCFGHRDYRQALSLVDRLLAKPQFAQDPSGSSFLRSQQAICRQSLNPLKSQAQNSPTLNPQAHPSLPPVVAAAPVAASLPLADCGPRALLLACQTLGRPATLEELRRQAGMTASGTSLQGLAQAAKAHGLKAKGVQVDLAALEQLSQPAIVWVDGNQYVALLSVEGEQATIYDPNHPKEEVISTHELLQRSGGVLLTLSS